MFFESVAAILKYMCSCLTKPGGGLSGQTSTHKGALTLSQFLALHFD